MMEHVNRMILIPEEFYLSLLSERDHTIHTSPLDTHLKKTSAKMKRILSTPAMNDEQKMALYNAQFKRLQKLKEERSERLPYTNVNVKSAPPVTDVHLTSVAENITSALKSALENLHSSRLRSSSTSSYASADASGMDDTRKNSNVFDDEEEESEHRTPSPQPHKKVMPARNASKIEKEKAISDKTEELAKFMKANSKALGIDEKGRILDSNNQPINLSDYRSAAKRFVDAGTTSPPGMRTLRARLNKLPGAEKVLEKMTGKGIKLNIARPSKSVFRPQLWPIPIKF